MLLALLMSIAVQGVVVAEDGSPLPGVTVTLVQAGTRIQTITDANGKFAFPNTRPELPSTVRAEFAGFTTREIKNVGFSADLRIRLEYDESRMITLACGQLPLVLQDSLSVTTLSSFTLSKLPF